MIKITSYQTNLMSSKTLVNLEIIKTKGKISEVMRNLTVQIDSRFTTIGAEMQAAVEAELLAEGINFNLNE